MDSASSTVELQPFSLDRVFQAVEDVRQRLLKATRVLKAANIPAAVVGGNAVASWVGRIDKSATRNTQDVDILIRRDDLDAAIDAMEAAGFHFAEVMDVAMFLDGPDASPRHAVHLLFAEEKVDPRHATPAPGVNDAVDAEEFRVVDLEPLVGMKLNSNRDKDRVHIRDMISVGLIDQTWTDRFDEPLKSRLQELLDDPYG